MTGLASDFRVGQFLARCDGVTRATCDDPAGRTFAETNPSSLAARTPEPEHIAATPARTITYLGMDVHKDSITIAVLPALAKAPMHLERLPNDCGS